MLQDRTNFPEKNPPISGHKHAPHHKTPTTYLVAIIEKQKNVASMKEEEEEEDDDDDDGSWNLPAEKLVGARGGRPASHSPKFSDLGSPVALMYDT